MFECLNRKKKREYDLFNPEFYPPTVVMADVECKERGSFKTKSGYPLGLIVHTTDGRSLKGDYDAKNTLKYLARHKLGCMVMSRTGKIFNADNMALDVVGAHAGSSKWKTKDKTYRNLSYYCLGIEICCAGKLKADGSTYFDESSGEYATQDWPNDVGNIQHGLYHKASGYQVEVLKKLCVWLVANIPGFRVDMILGHDEVSRSGKTDPGGSIGMPMAKLRQLIAEKLIAEKLAQ